MKRQFNDLGGLSFIFSHKDNMKKEMMGFLWQKNHVLESKFPAAILLTKIRKYSSSHSS